MKEIEVKILGVNVKEVIKKIEALGGKKISEGKQDIIILDTKEDKFLKNNELLRLRKNSNETELAFKKKISKDDVKIMEELEVHVDNFELMRKIFIAIGFKEATRYNKYRISYKLGNVRFELDTYENIPTFLEIEAPDTEKVKEFVGKLGFSMSDAKAWTGKEVIEYYRKRR